MDNRRALPVAADLLLLGGGHANVQVLKRLAMAPIGGLRITLISDQTHAPYSGMLPGYLAGYYDYEDCHFDLRRLCEELGQRFVRAKIAGIDSRLKSVRLEGRPDMRYDCAAINIGIAPRPVANLTEAAAETLIPMKPISQFIAHWDRLVAALKNYRGAAPLPLAVVGAGAAGVEIALILKMLIDRHGWNAKVCLIHRHRYLVSAGDPAAGRRLSAVLKQAGVDVYPDTDVVEAQAGALLLQDAAGRRYPMAFHRVLIATEAAAPAWFAESGLPVDPAGFLKVDGRLRVEGADALFAAGDCIHFTPSPLKKAGVYAVRQGPVLAHNIDAHFNGRAKPKSFRPKKHVLSLITAGERRAITHQDGASLLSLLPPKLLWLLKNRIDRRFMRRFQAQSFASAPAGFERAMPPPRFSLVPNGWQDNTCGGCGCKLAASALEHSLERLEIPQDARVLLGVEAGEDCALTRFTEGRLCLQSLDQFRAFVSDPYVLGQIAAQHALSDIYAMGGRPTTAEAGLTLPPSVETIQREDVFQLMSGILDTLTKSGASLVGGHTGEGAETAIAVAVQGEVEPERLLKKRALRPGNRLILTKPVGTGVMFAANMLAQANGRWVDAALACMRQSNGDALAVIRAFEIAGCTDITGFGLLGHAYEMTGFRGGGPAGIRIVYASIPRLDGADVLFSRGYAASLAERNRRSLRAVLGDEVTAARFPALFDPQTSGGLLFSVPAEASNACLAALHAAGFSKAAAIGDVIAQNRIEIV